MPDRIGFLFPGIIALAVMSTAMVSLAIATGFERSTKVLKRLGASPLRRGELLAAKTVSIVLIEVLQIVVLTAEALLLGWRPDGVQVAALVGALVLGTIAFAGIGLLLAGTLPALTTLAAANGLYLVLLLRRRHGRTDRQVSVLHAPDRAGAALGCAFRCVPRRARWWRCACSRRGWCSLSGRSPRHCWPPGLFRWE